MPSCDNINYQDLAWCDGEPNLPGIKGNVYTSSKRDIVAWPTLPKTFTTNQGELATYTGEFTLAAGKKWKKIGIVVEKSPVESKSQGVRPSKTFMNTATLQHPGTEEEATGFVRQANNDDLVYLVETKKGKFRVIGNDMYQTDTAIDQKLGGAATDEMGTTLTVSVTDICPAPFYTGEIVTEDGTINPAP
jgi:hypothetical protein